MYCEINGLKVFYKTEGKGFPLVMLHGYSLDHRVLTGCMEPLLKKATGFQRIYFDLPGMGKTKAAASIQNSDDMLNQVMEIVESLIPSKRFAVVGLSYGGYLARGLANRMQRRVEGLFLICPVVNFLRSKRRVPELDVLERDKELIEELSMTDADDFQSCVVLQNRRVWNRFRDEVLPGVRLADYSLLERVRDTEFSFDPDEKASEFHKPVSILLARHDNSVGYEDGIELFHQYPKASLVIGESAGHNFQIEQEQLFNAAVVEWLQRIKSTLT